MKTLFHLATDNHDKPKAAVFVDGNGFKYTVPYDEPTEIQSDFMADKIVEHCHYFGIVIVHTNRTRTGIDYDMKDARERALESLRISEKACINDYITTQLEDRVRNNFPPLPPVGRALECVVKHKYNLLKAGIRCIGWEPPYEMDDPGLGNTPAAVPANIMETITQLQAQLLQQNQLIMQLLQPRQTAATASSSKKGKNIVESSPSSGAIAGSGLEQDKAGAEAGTEDFQASVSL